MSVTTCVRSFALGAVALGLSVSALAQQKLLPEQSEITFVARQMGVPLDGKFRKFDAQISFDVAKPQTSKIAFTVDVGSATLGSRETDAELPKAPWFNVPKFPQASFQSSSVKALGGGKYQITGVLGEGAMGVVYKGFDPGIQRAVALKTVRRQLLQDNDHGPSVVARFRNEAQAAGRLSHPGIASVYEYGEDEQCERLGKRERDFEQQHHHEC